LAAPDAILEEGTDSGAQALSRRERVPVLIEEDDTQKERTIMFDAKDAERALDAAGIDISHERYTVEDIAAGMNVELEHGKRFPDLDVTGDDPVISLKIALAHLREFPDYYARLEVMEREAEAAWDAQSDEQ
jgi:hypothetical protein